MSLTAVGDTLNVGSRLEGLAKDLDAGPGWISPTTPRPTVTIRGRSTPITA